MKIGSLSDRNLSKSGKTVKSIVLQNPDGTKVTLEMKALNQLVKDKGLDKAGNVQMFHTQNVLRRIKKYMPFRTGITYKLTVIQTDIRKPEIVTDTPYAHYLFEGEVWGPNLPRRENGVIVGWWSPKVKHPTGRKLEYDKTKNPQAGPRWDKALSAAEGDALRADLQRYIDRRSGR